MGRMITFLARIMEDSVGTDDEVGSVWGIGKCLSGYTPMPCIGGTASVMMTPHMTIITMVTRDVCDACHVNACRHR